MGGDIIPSLSFKHKDQNEMKVHAVIERAADGSYSIYTKEEFKDFVLIATGRTPDEAIGDMNDVVAELKADCPDMPELEFEYSYDVASFLKMFNEEFSMSGLQAITGIHQKQLHHFCDALSGELGIPLHIAQRSKDIILVQPRPVLLCVCLI